MNEADRMPLSPPIETRRPRRRRRLRWIIGGGVGLLVLLVLVVVAAAALSPGSAPPPLALPSGAAPAVGAGDADGTWRVAPGSVAGFRLTQTFLGNDTDVVGRTGAVTGDVAVAHGQVVSANLRVGLAAITVGGKAPPQLALSLETRSHPDATFTLTRPFALGAATTAGTAATATAAGRLTLRGVTRAVTFTVTGRWDGPSLRAVGSIPVALADWGVEGPENYGWLGSLSDHGTAEFLLVLRR
ncbi:YceI family protein [Microbispora sp. NPDC049125]|uniref:YceI family protein n=1 Tax=Microbispora sp. NPDC049125 TaxID=3154929 RepID=UPI0034669F90